jgi:predicted dehydrogenase
MSRTSRRNFIKTGAAIGAGYWALGGLSPKVSLSANEVIRFASIGIGGKGDSDSKDAGRSGDMVAYCDIDEKQWERGSKQWPKAKVYYDFRKMLDEMGSSIDAVTVSTPDHTHGPASVMAMKLGKHCFTQKPLTHSVYEARVMAQVARENKLATQMGNQGTANNSLREAAAMLQSGNFGKITEVHVWTNRPVWPQGKDRPKDEPPVPATLHWPEFIGCAKMRPYHPDYHPFKWRGWWDFGTGALGDMACHTLNMPYMALDLKDPVWIQAETSGHNGETYPSWSIINFLYPANDKRGEVKLTWYDGGKLPSQELLGPDGKNLKIESSGALIIGDKGRLYAPGDYAEKTIYTLGVDKPKVEWEKSPGHFEEWVRAIKGGQPARSNFQDYAGGLTETVLLGNLAVWAAKEPGVGKKIEWNAKKMEATNAPEVAHIIKPEFHNGYKVEA